MATLSNLKELRIGVSITHNGEPYVIIDNTFHKPGKGQPVMRVKMRNLISGQVLEQTYKPGDAVEEADLERSRAQFLYTEGSDLFFMDNNSFEQFSFTKEAIGNISDYVAEGQDVDVMLFEGKHVTVSLPLKVELEVTEAPPGVKGDSANNPTKQVTLETGMQINVPIFINKGDKIRVNTGSGDYVERVTS